LPHGGCSAPFFLPAFHSARGQNFARKSGAAHRRLARSVRHRRPPVDVIPRVRVTRRLHFSSAHRLFNPDWSDERNREIFGDCSNPAWHGHNYDLDLTVEGPVDPETGYVIDLKLLKDIVERRVIAHVDHRNLNTQVDWLEGVNPTTENLAVAIWDRLEGTLPAGVNLSRIVLHETERNSVEYAGPGR